MVAAFLLICVLSLIFFISRRKYDYWKREKIPYLAPELIFGNYGDFFLQKLSFSEVVQRLCQQLPDEPIFGAFFGTEPVLIVQHPEMIKLVMTKDFQYFQGREISIHSHKEFIGSNLFFTYGDRWKAIRHILSPIFSSSKLKEAFRQTDKISQDFEKMLDTEIQTENEVEARFMLARFSLDSVCSWIFEVNTDAMGEGIEKNAFGKMISVLFEMSRSRALKSNFRSVWPGIFYGLGFKLFPNDVQLFFKRFLIEVFNKRGNKPSGRQDLVDLLLAIREKSTICYNDIQLEVDDDFLTCQASAFYAAGVEATSSSTSYTLYELAKHPKAQKRCWDEIDTYLNRNHGKLNYDCVTDLPYLSQCLHEALRLYPIQGVITRDVCEAYRLPCGAHLEQGLRIHIPIFHLHRNPKYFEDPEEFRPERFSKEGKKNILPYSYLPFSEGPRNCIGTRLGKILAMVALITVLKKYKIELAEGMPTKIRFDPLSFVPQSTCGLRLKLVAREGWKKRKYQPAEDDKLLK